ncbi:poly polymerase papalpha [Stylonychia lemnae]|uniref:polynucleotide adenylyltransferase n=1 Tax=Stylonychia lemnae TaxID=5949 RepID=A0A078AQH7_STYLE|nr:poly polymerase papalpha [Stylonychia lemnae]|eukprot:CDW83178.1 poly polymerase papalpha [Stylonychia lemnae]
MQFSGQLKSKIITPRTSLVETYKILFGSQLINENDLEDSHESERSQISSIHSNSSQNEREKAVSQLQLKIEPFFISLSKQKDLYDKYNINSNVETFKLTPFGSAMFGGYDKNSDIDVLLQSFDYLLSREEFFSKFAVYLRSEHVQANIQQEIPYAQIPIIKFEFMSKQFDLLYCSMLPPQNQTQKRQLEDDEFYQNMENVVNEKCNILSFRGWSNCHYIYKKIRDKECYSWCLKIIKTWAKQRGIYGFNFGYLNGISLIIMLAKADQLIFKDITSNNVSSEKILGLNESFVGDEDVIYSFSQQISKKLDVRVQETIFRFFEIFSNWDYKDPIFIQELPDWHLDQDLYFVASKEIFPVITPEKPYKCTTHQMTAGAKKQIVNELQRAQNLCTLIQKRDVIQNLIKQQYEPENNEELYERNSDLRHIRKESYDLDILNDFAQITWKELFNPYQFFNENGTFVQIEVLTEVYSDKQPLSQGKKGKALASRVKVAQTLHHEYKGLYESRFKLFQSFLQLHLGIDDIQIFADCID